MPVALQSCRAAVGGWHPWLVRLVALLVVAGIVPAARAAEYEVFVDIDDDEDLLELFNTDQISEDTYNTLLELLRRGTNLETADRETLYSLPNLTYAEVDSILAYRDEAGRIGDPANLVAAGALSRRALAAIAPFILIPRPEGAKIGVDGFVRYEVRFAPGDKVAPPMFLQARVNTLRHLTLGIAAGLARTRVNDVAYDPTRDALSADAPKPRPRLPKYFAMWDTDKWGVIAGTYRIGFGQRLVFDTTNRYTPNGFLLDHTVQRTYDLTRQCSESTGEVAPQCDLDARMAPDYAFREGQQGVAIGAKKIELPQGHLQAYGWFSFQPRSVYQTHVRDISRCPDPLDLSNDDCAAPAVFHRGEPILAPQTKFKNKTLPQMYDDILGGANISYFHDRRTHIGVTGFGAKPVWLVQGADLDFQEFDRNPYGGAFGAVGADFSWGRRFADLFGEVARSFDNMNKFSEQGGGGFAGLLRNTLSFEDHEVELSARYYGTDYANPFAGPLAASDFYDGLSARDEAGGRVRYTGHIAEILDIRAYWDLWGALHSDTPRTKAFVRGDVQATKRFRPGLWLQYDRRDLRPVDPLVCPLSGGPTQNAVATCHRQRISVTGRSRFDVHRRAYVTMQYRHDFQDGLFEGSSSLSSLDAVDSGGNPEGVDLQGLDLQDLGLDPIEPQDLSDVDIRNQRRQDINAYLLVGTTPIDKLRIRSRIRWQWDDIFDNGRYEHSIWGYLDVSYAFRRWAVPRVRYDIVNYLDSRDSTATRRNPEHWIRFEFSSRF